MDTLYQFIKGTPFRDLTFTDVLDIAIVSYVIYRIFLLLKGTRAAKMATGIFFVFLFYFFSNVLNLRVNQWILTNFVTYAVFGIIVIYQDEIRKILANIGSTRLFSGLAIREPRHDFEDIVLAAMTLSSKRIGALMVIERSFGLRSYMENGIMLNSELSYDLLVTIFQPETPLHDGAVIISKNRIAAASCFLPLTLEPHLSKEYGTRHRASIGITEETDAVVVVVSEETGQISGAVGGKLRKFQESDSLMRFLRECFAPPEKSSFRLSWPKRKEKQS